MFTLRPARHAITSPEGLGNFPEDANFGDCQAGLTSVKLIEHLGIAAMAGRAKHCKWVLALPATMIRAALLSKRERGEVGRLIGWRGGFRRLRYMESVMKLSRTVSYAVRATLQLAQLEAQGPVPCSRLAADGKMPE